VAVPEVSMRPVYAIIDEKTGDMRCSSWILNKYDAEAIRNETPGGAILERQAYHVSYPDSRKRGRTFEILAFAFGHSLQIISVISFDGNVGKYDWDQACNLILREHERGLCQVVS